jgi:threonine-phosphate decarboxylase
LQRLRKAEHGGRGAAAGELLDFSVNLNPCAPALDWNIPEESARIYPDDTYDDLKEIIARHHHRTPDEICVGNGSVEVIRTLCHTLLSPGTSVFVSPHTFSEYALSAQLSGAVITHSPEVKVEISFLCNPENPSGVLTPRNEVVGLINDRTEKEGVLCVDEAFIDLADPSESVSGIRNTHLFVLRSLTKSFSMAGVRFGYGIGDPDLIEKMEVMRPPWSVNAFAHSMALQAFDKYPTLEMSRQFISRERKRITSRCRELGLVP